MEQTNQNKDIHGNKKIAMRVSTISIFINLFLALFKLMAGIVAQSGAMISDAVHSASDVFSTFIVIIGVNISSKKSDTEHQYGHERLECVASIILAVILAATGFGIGISGYEKIIAGNYGDLQIPGVLALIAAVTSIAVKEWMYWYTRAAAKKINSGALMADAWHHRSDALSSVGAFVGIFGARLGFPILDPIASVVICIFIEKASYDIFKDAIDKMVDKSCDNQTIQEIREVISEQEGVEAIDEVRTRLFGAKIYVDVEISADGSKSLNETHEIAEKIHSQIETKIPMVKHCMVHVNPTVSE
ncbi:MAG: cation diffusion facilitator family transporter [Lachnotalea sp.]